MVPRFSPWKGFVLFWGGCAQRLQMDRALCNGSILLLVVLLRSLGWVSVGLLQAKMAASCSLVSWAEKCHTLLDAHPVTSPLSQASVHSPPSHSLCLIIYLFWERERHTECERGRGRERDGDTELEAGARLSAVSTEPYMGSNPWTMRSSPEPMVYA